MVYYNSKKVVVGSGLQTLNLQGWSRPFDRDATVTRTMNGFPEHDVEYEGVCAVSERDCATQESLADGDIGFEAGFSL